jgi:hypothetical protein
MATDGLSLVGFFADQQHAINHLRLDCVPTDPSDAALIAHWNKAQAAIKNVPPLPPVLAAQLPMPGSAQNICRRWFPNRGLLIAFKL